MIFEGELAYALRRTQGVLRVLARARHDVIAAWREDARAVKEAAARSSDASGPRSAAAQAAFGPFVPTGVVPPPPEAWLRYVNQRRLENFGQEAPLADWMVQRVATPQPAQAAAAVQPVESPVERAAGQAERPESGRSLQSSSRQARGSDAQTSRWDAVNLQPETGTGRALDAKPSTHAQPQPAAARGPEDNAGRPGPGLATPTAARARLGAAETSSDTATMRWRAVSPQPEVRAPRARNADGLAGSAAGFDAQARLNAPFPINAPARSDRGAAASPRTPFTFLGETVRSGFGRTQASEEDLGSTAARNVEARAAAGRRPSPSALIQGNHQALLAAGAAHTAPAVPGVAQSWGASAESSRLVTAPAVSPALPAGSLAAASRALLSVEAAPARLLRPMSNFAPALATRGNEAGTSASQPERVNFEPLLPAELLASLDAEHGNWPSLLARAPISQITASDVARWEQLAREQSQA